VKVNAGRDQATRNHDLERRDSITCKDQMHTSIASPTVCQQQQLTNVSPPCIGLRISIYATV